MTMGDKIRYRRIEIGLSQEQLAEKVGYSSRSTINKIETNLRDVKQSKIVPFANALEVTPAYLLGLEKENTPQSYDNEVFKLFLKLPENKKQAIANIIKEFSEED